MRIDELADVDVEIQFLGHQLFQEVCSSTRGPSRDGLARVVVINVVLLRQAVVIGQAILE